MTQLCLLPRQGRLIIVTVMTIALTLQALEAVVAYLSRPIGRNASASLCQSAFRLALIIWRTVFIYILEMSYYSVYLDGSLIAHQYPIRRYAAVILLVCASAAVTAVSKRPHYIPAALAAPVLLPQAEAMGDIWLMAVIFAHLIMTVSTGISAALGIRKIRTDLTLLSIKQAVDGLDTGVMLCRRSGQIVIENQRMNELESELCGGRVRSGLTLYRLMLDRSEDPESGATVRLSDGSTVIFRVTELRIGRRERLLLTADDVTLAYSEILRLRQTQSDLDSANAELRERISNLGAECREQALVKARIRLHDLLGQRLSMILMTLRGENMAPGEEATRLLADSMLSIDRDIRGYVITAQPEDELSALREMMRGLGIRLIVSGSLPKDRAAASAFAEVIREAVTNSVRHGFASEIRADLGTDGEKGEYRLNIRDNGRPESSEWREGGGISGIRKRVSDLGGRISITSAPSFTLDISVPASPGRRNEEAQYV